MIVNNPDAPEHMKAFSPVSEKSSQQDAERALPPPPPYSPHAGPSRVPQPAPNVPAIPSGPTSVFQPLTTQTVNHFELFSKHDAIAGTFVVDPALPSPMANLSRNLRRKPDSVWGKTRGRKNKRQHEVNASFQTRHGRINLDLAISSKEAGQATPFPGDKLPTRVYVSTHHGRVSVNVHEVQPSRSLDLQVESRHGRINLLLPPTFDGPLVVQARSLGAVQFLPHFAARARTVRGKDRETVVLVSSPFSSQSASTLAIEAKQLGELAGPGSDRCLVRTRHGKITIGISGLDKIEEPLEGSNLFEKVGRFFETQGRAFGQYMETQARLIEKRAQEWAGNVNTGNEYHDGKGPEVPGRFPYERYESASQAGGRSAAAGKQ
ncbi:hypothetical protein BD310DRAFT_328006 [Dichomitus squalens]|uniref:DUF7330 domain-containing protein n=1 Tax=Dichomitus squalens TaxID=114155 RepID=A0A4Q9PAD2_9APHY|nr:hypothetical protein BD310DRAFT_328006 [Dichomitus squalens]